VHLAADAIPLGLCVTRQQVPQLLIHLGNCLVVSLMGFLEHLLGLLNLHLLGRNINACRDGFSRTHGFLEILQLGGPVQDFLPFVFFLAGTISFEASPNRNKNRQMSNKERDNF
jgi:hypothetical protein